MCDCYEHKCECCNELVPMHIGDYRFPRSDFRVWCGSHISKAPKGAVIFKSIKGRRFSFDGFLRCAIYGPEVGGDGSNAPNVGCDYRETVKEK